MEENKQIPYTDTCFYTNLIKNTLTEEKLMTWPNYS